VFGINAILANLAFGGFYISIFKLFSLSFQRIFAWALKIKDSIGLVKFKGSVADLDGRLVAVKLLLLFQKSLLFAVRDEFLVKSRTIVAGNQVHQVTIERHYHV
jgi:hypothetical protein